VDFKLITNCRADLMFGSIIAEDGSLG